MPKKIDFNSISDEELVKLTLGDQQHFVWLIRRYEDKLTRYVRRLSNLSIEDAEDLLQEIFIKVYQNLNAFDPKLKFSSWIYRIAHNHTISNYRKLKARAEGSVVDLEQDILENMASDLDVVKNVDQEILREQMSKKLEKLDLKYKEVLVLKYIEDKDYKEISDIIKKPIGTVGTLINRAKKELKKEFDK